MRTLYRSKAPLRLGLAGGGTDVSPYCDLYGGAILNASISLYAYATIEPVKSESITFQSMDLALELHYPHQDEISYTDDKLQLLKGAHRYMVKKYGPFPSGYKLSTYVDAPAGSGLGTSSTLMVAILGAYIEWLNLPFGEHDVARLAYEIERKELQMQGGKQDQYAAAFGGVNFMEFFKEEKVVVNPLRIKSQYLEELAHNLVLYYTDSSRLSSHIIQAQAQNVVDGMDSAIEAMHQLKAQAVMMKEALLVGQIDEVGHILDFGFQQKKKMAKGISNEAIEERYQAALKAGATGGKISGAGGGGFMIFYCPANTRYAVMKVLENFPGSFKNYQFEEKGLRSW